MSVKQKKIVKMAGIEQVDALIGRIVMHQSEFRNKIPCDVCQWAQQNPKFAIVLFIKSLMKHCRQVVLNEYLRPLFEGEEIFIEACNGLQTLAEANDVFECIDPNFKKRRLNNKGKATCKMPIRAFELLKKGSYAQFFGSLFGVSLDGVKIEDFIEQNRENLRKHCFQQHQIKSFCRKHKNKLRDKGHATFFLFEEGDNFFVANVYFYSDGTLRVDVRRFEDDYRWIAEYCHRVVVPQLVA